MRAKRQHLYAPYRNRLSGDTLCGRSSKNVDVVSVPHEPMPKNVCRACKYAFELKELRSQELANLNAGIAKTLGVKA